jgi:epsilon-lactone hydrolase
MALNPNQAPPSKCEGVFAMNLLRHRGTLLGIALLLFGTGAGGQGLKTPAPLKVDADGTVHVPAMAVPPSEYLTPQAKAYLIEHLEKVQQPAMLAQPNGVPPLLAGYLARQRILYPVNRKETTIGGVHAYLYTPKGGVTARNANRLLIDLHGGGFRECWPGCAELESIPITSLGGITVVSVDYRQGPKFRFPAASEDVASVYRELLKTHRPENIGIYGCSAGGMLTGESVAWFQTHGLPRPGAVGIFCAGMTVGAGFGGDATYIAAPIGEARLFAPPPQRSADNGKSPGPVLGYFEGADLHDPLVAPASSLEVLAKFPPTLIITGTRGFELSSAVYSHSLLVKEGVDAELHVWEGLFHGFFYNPDVPESRDCYDVIVKFFDRHLGT